MWTIEESAPANTEKFETTPMIHPNGFREYDMRWLYPEQINLLGMQCLGAGIATQLWEIGEGTPKVVVGHDYREYSMAVKHALTVGLMSSGAEVFDVGLCITPMAYYARWALGVPGVAMVTASHNENGWTGVKVGAMHPLTHGPDEMSQLKEIVLRGEYRSKPGRYQFRPDVKENYIAELTNGISLQRKLRVVVATGNGTAGLFAPEVLKRIGCDVICLHCDLDWNFPQYNPNPEDVGMLHSVRDEVLRTGADLGLAFDGDGDRLGVVDDRGDELFSDKLGLLLARRLSSSYPESRFVVDVKSTGLFMTDPVLAKNGSAAEYWLTGHSYIKKRVWDQKALAGFEKSGHFFFAEPIGKGYDDALLSAVLVCSMLDAEGRSLSSLRNELPRTWQSPTMSPHCPDEQKYQVVAGLRSHYEDAVRSGEKICNQRIKDLITINGVRVVLEDGTWGLVRASSNKPSLVVVVESPLSETRMREMFHEIDARLSETQQVGAYDQAL